MSEKWWDMSDDELDDLFREASDKVDVPFDSLAYNKLRQKIAEQPMSEPPRGFKKRWLFLLAGLFLMVGVGLVYRFGNDLTKNNSTETIGNVENKNAVKMPLLSVSPQTTKPLPVEIQTITKEDLTELPVNTGTHNQTTAEENLIKSSVNTGTHTTGEENLIKSSVRTQTIKREKPRQSYAKANETSKQTEVERNSGQSLVRVEMVNSLPSLAAESNNLIVKQNQKDRSENDYYNSKSVDNQSITKNNSKSLKDKNSKNDVLNQTTVEQNTLLILENSSIVQDTNPPKETINRTNFYDVDFLKNKDSKSLLTDIHTELPDYVDSLPSTIKPVKFSRFGVRLILSPDFNSIDNLGKMALGSSIGLLFEYKISEKLIVQTGLVYSNKSYVGSFDDYHNWTDWKGYHPSKPTGVDGGCKVFDVPINLRLNLFQKPKQTWFVSSGVSSYWMINENYTYNYAWTPSRAVNWSDNSKYYFSVLNFSVGLERQISKRFNLQIEPYLKTPLKNVGRGGVSLYSSGVLFSTKYSF